MLRVVWSYKNRHGSWAIAQSPDGRWHPVCDDEDLGSYHSPASALDDLVGGHTFSPSSGVDPEDCDLPEDIGEWTRHFR